MYGPRARLVRGYYCRLRSYFSGYPELAHFTLKTSCFAKVGKETYKYL